LRILLEEADVWIPDSFDSLLGDIEELYNGGFTKAEIETGRYQSHRIQQFGIRRFEDIESRLSWERRSRLFDVALFVAQKQEQDIQEKEGDSGCTTASRPLMNTLV